MIFAEPADPGPAQNFCEALALSGTKKTCGQGLRGFGDRGFRRGTPP